MKKSIPTGASHRERRHFRLPWTGGTDSLDQTIIAKCGSIFQMTLLRLFVNVTMITGFGVGACACSSAPTRLDIGGYNAGDQTVDDVKIQYGEHKVGMGILPRHVDKVWIDTHFPTVSSSTVSWQGPDGTAHVQKLQMPVLPPRFEGTIYCIIESNQTARSIAVSQEDELNNKDGPLVWQHLPYLLYKIGEF